MSTRSCQDVRPRLSAYLDDDLDASLAGEIRAHLETCAACRSELELLRLTIGALRRLPDLPPPAAILSGVRDRLRSEPWHRRLFSGGRRRFDFPLSAAATVLVVLGISLFVAHYPEMPKSVPRDSMPQSPVSLPRQERETQQAPRAQRSPIGGVADAGRQAAPPPTAPARRDLRAKGARGSAALPGSEYRGGAGAFTDSTVAAGAGAGAQDLDHAAPAGQPGPPAGPAAAESKAEQPRLTLPAAAPKVALREEPPPEASLAAAPPLLVDAVREPASEGPLGFERHPDLPADSGIASGQRGTDALAERDGKARTNSPETAMKVESRVAFARKADSFKDLEHAGIAKSKEKAAGSGTTTVACLLLPEGGSVEDLERVLEHEGAVGIVVGVLEPAELRDALARQRGRLVNRSDPSLGWTITARAQAPVLARVLATLAEKKGLIILEQPPDPGASGDSSQPLDLRITVFR